jgi:DNA-binding NtrC family response regulator
MAHGGTIFLDQVGELSPAMQAKLLRVIEAGEVMRGGRLRPRPIDVRFISATSRDLEAEVARGSFRSDMFFRLSGVSLRIPPLRERVREILPFAEMFVARTAERMAVAPRPRLSPDAKEVLVRYAWPGNIRELRNVVERAVLVCQNAAIGPDDLGLTRSLCRESGIQPRVGPPEPNSPFDGASSPLPDEPTRRDRADEKRRIIEALRLCTGNQTRAAKVLSMPRRTLVAKLGLYAIPRPRKPDPC